jgi:hypothetical protein
LLKKEIGGNAKATTAAPKTRERDREREEEKERERERRKALSRASIFHAGGRKPVVVARAKEYIFATTRTRTTKRDRRD